MTKLTANLNKYFAFIALVLLVFIPLGSLLMKSIFPDGSFAGFSSYHMLFEDYHLKILWNSLLLGFGVVLLSSAIAAPLAYFMSRTEMQRHRWIDVVLIVPFMTPPYIASMGWIIAMQRNGLVEQLFPFLSSYTPYFFSYFGMVLIMSLHLFPFIYLIMKNTLANIGGRLEEAATIHGGNFLYRLRKVIIPLFLSGYSMGALLVFVKTIGEFGTPVTLGNRIGFHVLTSEIHRYTSVWPIDFGAAATLSVLLLGVSMGVWYIQQWVADRNQSRVVSGKGQTTAQAKLGKWKIFAWGYLFFILFLAIGVPYFSVTATALMDVQSHGLAWSNLTLDHFKELFSGSGLDALLNSVFLATVAATISVFLGIWIAITVSGKKGILAKSTDFLSLAPNTVPGIVIVVGLILVWNATWNKVPIYNTWMMLVLTYVILYLPFTVQNIKAIYGQLGDSLFQAAKVSGASNFYQLRTILLPLLVPGILAGWMMTFAISMRELVGSLILRPPNMHTSATFIYSQFEQGSSSLGMAMALISVGFTTIVIIGVEQLKYKMQVYRR